MTLQPNGAIRILAAVLFTVSLPAPAAAQSREQRQLMADVRILQEQTQTLQNLITEALNAIKDVNARIDDQGRVTGKALADQKLVIDGITNNIREVREKLDDNTVRLGSLGDEVDAVRMGLQRLSTLPALTAPLAPPPGDPAAGPGASAAPGAPATPVADPAAVPPPPAGVAPAPPAPPIGASPQRLYDEGRSDYFLGQYDLAIAGFQTLITYFPQAERAADAQLLIGHSYFQQKEYEKAVGAYDATIANYPGAAVLPEAYYRKGLSLRNLKKVDEARAAFEFVAKTYPDSDMASLARQQLAQPKP